MSEIVAKQEETDESQANDIEELLQKLGENNLPIVMKISMGLISLEELKTIIELMNRPVVNIGDGLTLLHIAAQYNRCDLIDYLCGELHHPLEVSFQISL